MPDSRPHVIIIMADQLRRDALGPHTPHLNALARDGTAFNRCYCTSPLCVSARGSFFTGRYPNETGSIINPWEPLDKVHGSVRAGIPNLYTLLEKDWDSRHTGKQHLYTTEEIDRQADSPTRWDTLEKGYGPYLKQQGQRAPGGPAFRGMMPELAQNRFTRMTTYSIPSTGCYPGGFDFFYDGYIANTSVQAIREHEDGKPLMLNAMFLAPHPPLEIPEPWYSQIKPENVNLPDNVGRWGADQSPLQLWNLTGLLGARYGRDDWREIWRVYLGLVALLDHGVGLIIDELKTRGMYDDSLIIFTADHGEMLGSHMLWQKMCCYEEAAHVPLFIKLPAAMAAGHAEHTDQLVSHVDILPTVLECAGRPVPEGVSGVSLLPVMQGSPLERECVFIQFDGNGALGNFSRTVVCGHHKLNVDLFKDEAFFEMYDLAKDPQEMNNRAFEDESRVRELLARLIDHMQRTGDHLELTPRAYDTFLTGYAPFRNTVRQKADMISRL